MLLTKTAKVKWHGGTKKWYEDRGYIFTKYGDEFEIKVEDLTIGNTYKIEAKCDNCSIPINRQWSEYLKLMDKHDGGCYCMKCSINLFGKQKMIKTQLSKSKSFEQWCIENNRQEMGL